MSQVGYGPAYTTFDQSWAIGKPFCFDQVRLKLIGSSRRFVDLHWSEALLWLIHHRLD